MACFRILRRGLGLVLLLATLAYPQVAGADPQQDFADKEKRLNEAAGKSVTLADEVRVLDQRAAAKADYLADLNRQIAKGRRELEEVNRELSKLQAERRQAQQLLNRYVRAEYLEFSPDQFSVIAGNRSLTDSLRSLFYLGDLQAYADRIIGRLDEAGEAIERRRTSAGEVIDRLDTLSATAGQEASELAALRAGKQNLLAATQGQEAQFRAEYEAAKRQLEALGQFAKSARQRVASRVWDDSGFYFNQLDSRWIDHRLGWSNSSTLGDYGCGVTSLAMVYKHYGLDTTPPQLNEALKRTGGFVDDLLNWRNTAGPSGGRLALANSPYPLGRVDWGLIDRQLAAGHPVIVFVDRPGTLSHYVVLLKQQGSDYLMHDPIEGPYLRFRNYYQPASVFQFITFRRV